MGIEGSIGNSPKLQIKNKMLHELDGLVEASILSWQEATFRAITGLSVNDVDFEDPENVRGYAVWIHSFQELTTELEEDGYIKSTAGGLAGLPTVSVIPKDQPFGWD